MNYSGDAAEQVVRMSLNGIEVAAKISGKAAERLAVLLYAVLRDQKRTKGKVRLSNMLKSGKELKVFAVKDSELQKFCEEAKKYGVLYCVLKDKNAEDGLTDIMVRTEDAGKINRIFERFNLATIDMGSVKTEIQRSRTEKASEDIPVPERTTAGEDPVREFMDRVVKPEKKNPSAQEVQNENPIMARSTKSRQSEPLSGAKKTRGVGDDEGVSANRRPSVRKELEEIRTEQRQKQRDSVKEHVEVKESVYIPVPTKKSPDKEVR